MNNEQQKNILDHAVAVFGEIARDPNERASRFLEEALETTQAVGLKKDDVLKLVEYVYSRPVGDVRQELGGAIITLESLAEAVGLSLHMCEILESARFFTIDPEAFRAKQNKKALSSVGLASK